MATFIHPFIVLMFPDRPGFEADSRGSLEEVDSPLCRVRQRLKRMKSHLKLAGDRTCDLHILIQICKGSDGDVLLNSFSNSLRIRHYVSYYTTTVESFHLCGIGL